MRLPAEFCRARRATYESSRASLRISRLASEGVMMITGSRAGACSNTTLNQGRRRGSGGPVRRSLSFAGRIHYRPTNKAAEKGDWWKCFIPKIRVAIKRCCTERTT